MRQHTAFPDKKDCTMGYTQPTSEQRYCISRQSDKMSVSRIAKDTNCRKSTVSREIRRNSVNGKYDPKPAQQQYKNRKHRCHPRVC